MDHSIRSQHLKGQLWLSGRVGCHSHGWGLDRSLIHRPKCPWAESQSPKTLHPDWRKHCTNPVYLRFTLRGLEESVSGMRDHIQNTLFLSEELFKIHAYINNNKTLECCVKKVKVKKCLPKTTMKLISKFNFDAQVLWLTGLLRAKTVHIKRKSACYKTLWGLW